MTSGGRPSGEMVIYNYSSALLESSDGDEDLLLSDQAEKFIPNSLLLCIWGDCWRNCDIEQWPNYWATLLLCITYWCVFFCILFPISGQYWLLRYVVTEEPVCYCWLTLPCRTTTLTDTIPWHCLLFSLTIENCVLGYYRQCDTNRQYSNYNQ